MVKDFEQIFLDLTRKKILLREREKDAKRFNLVCIFIGYNCKQKPKLILVKFKCSANLIFIKIISFLIMNV